MALLTINNRLLNASIHNNHKILFVGLIFIIYFVWMDIALFVNLQRWSPPPIQPANSITSPINLLLSEQPIFNNRTTEASPAKANVDKSKLLQKYRSEGLHTVFKPLSVKLIMVDHMSHYVHDVVARFMDDTLHFTDIFPWITPNMVSFFGLGSAMLGSYLMISDKLLTRQIGSVLFELRNLADGLDGVVYRSRLRNREIEILNMNGEDASKSNIIYQSNYGTSGYNVDIWCDGFAGLFLVFAILVRFLRHPPQKNSSSSSKILMAPCVTSNSSTSNSSSNYSYHQLNNKLEEKSSVDSLEMNSMDNYSKLNNRNLLLSEKSSELAADNAQVSINLAAFKNQTSNNEQDYEYDGHVSRRQVKLIVVSFGLRLLFTALIWDYFVHKYHDAIMVFSNNPTQRKMQATAFKSIGMWLIMWFWRLGCSCAMLEHLTISNYVDKLWDYLVFTSYIGWAYLIILTLFTQIHYTELYESLNAPFL